MTTPESSAIRIDPATGQKRFATRAAQAEEEHPALPVGVAMATLAAMTIYVVLDLEHPRRGLIRLDETDRLLEQLRDSIR